MELLGELWLNFVQKSNRNFILSPLFQLITENENVIEENIRNYYQNNIEKINIL